VHEPPYCGSRPLLWVPPPTVGPAPYCGSHPGVLHIFTQAHVLNHAHTHAIILADDSCVQFVKRKSRERLANRATLAEVGCFLHAHRVPPVTSSFIPLSLPPLHTLSLPPFLLTSHPHSLPPSSLPHSLPPPSLTPYLPFFPPFLPPSLPPTLCPSLPPSLCHSLLPSDPRLWSVCP